MEQLTQIAVQLPNRPGTLGRVARALAEEGVNIVAILAPEATGTGVLRLIPDSLENARRAFDRLRVSYTTEEVLSIRLKNEPGALAEIAEELAIAQIPIEFLYATTDGAGRAERVILSVADTARAESVLRSKSIE